jgi:hypothetical protein
MITDQEVEVFLSHYGVKGMKWGVRKERSSGERSGRSIKREGKRDAKQIKKISKKGGEGSVSKLSQKFSEMAEKATDTRYTAAVNKQLVKNQRTKMDKLRKGAAAGAAIVAGARFVNKQL